jgi:hypothetical protein
MAESNEQIVKIDLVDDPTGEGAILYALYSPPNYYTARHFLQVINPDATESDFRSLVYRASENYRTQHGRPPIKIEVKYKDDQTRINSKGEKVTKPYVQHRDYYVYEKDCYDLFTQTVSNRKFIDKRVVEKRPRRFKRFLSGILNHSSDELLDNIMTKFEGTPLKLVEFLSEHVKYTK